MAAYRSARYADAIAWLTPVACADGESAAMPSRFYLGRAHYRLAVSHYTHRRYREAAEHFEESARWNPDGGDFAQYLVGCYAGIRQYDRAVHEYERLLDRDPDDTDLRIRLALAKWKQDNTIDALALINEGLRRRPGRAELHYQRGVMLAADGDLPGAEREFKTTIAYDPSHAPAMERLAQCYSVTNRYERCLHYLEKAHHLQPSNPRIGWQLSLLAATHAGSDPEVDWSVNERHLALDEVALDQLGDALIAEPDFVEAFLELPVSAVDTDVFSILAEIFERALAKHPDYADLHYHCGQVYRRLGQDRNAIVHAERAVLVNPRYVSALVLLAQLYRQIDFPDAAVERLKQAVAAGGDYPDVHYLMGRLYQTGGEMEGARRAYQRALDLNEVYAEARQALADLPV
jgi:tetratricopeptide (TPR) repeat protein